MERPFTGAPFLVALPELSSSLSEILCLSPHNSDDKTGDTHCPTTKTSLSPGNVLAAEVNGPFLSHFD
jgi:hypothetical protein